MRRALRAAGVGAIAAFVLAAPEQGAGQDQAVSKGRDLYVEGCASCHGLDARGIEGVAPSLEGVGAASADFYLSTGRMPLEDPKEQPLRADPAYPRDQIDALVAYVASLGAGPEIPEVHAERGSVSQGLEAFTAFCAGCHQIVGEGGAVIGGAAPPLDRATPEQIAEAVRIGPHLMPRFGEQTIDDRTLDSIVRYIQLTNEPRDEGGWAIGHIGPVPEGLVAWLIAGVALLAIARLLGERSE